MVDSHSEEQRVAVSHSDSEYRADIDGLRAVAVLAVVMFHAFPRILGGGFVGVDVFFVISGYLISAIIFDGLKSGSFCFTHFYTRRVRRIFPALLLTLTACITFGWFALLPDEYRHLGKHVLGSAGFVSNLMLWAESGYFDTNSESKVLLHLWSLGVEEQFYLIWPLLLWTVWRLHSSLTLAIVGMLFISFAMNIFTSQTNPIADFYSPLTRFWELMIGALLARWEMVRPRSKRSESANSICNAQAFAGAGALLFAILTIDRSRTFPGYWAMLPTLGAALIISAGREAWINRTVLSWRPLVWVGLISFPLYLWHWPILTFAQILQGGIPSRSIRIGIVLTSILLAWVTFIFVERPIRMQKVENLKAAALVSLMAIFGCIGAAMWIHDGLPSRGISADPILAENAAQFVWASERSENCIAATRINAKFCQLYGDSENINFVIIGDSTANALAPGLGKRFGNSGSGVLNLGEGSCLPVRGLVPSDEWGGRHSPRGTNCVATMEVAYQYILASPRIKTVLLAFFGHDIMQWGLPGLDGHASIEARAQAVNLLLTKEIEALKEAGKSVIISYDGILLNVDPKRCIGRPFSLSAPCSVHNEDIVARQQDAAVLDKYFKTRTDICMLSQRDMYFDRGRTIPLDHDGVTLFRDSHHLSYRGSEVMALALADSTAEGCRIRQ